MVSTLPDLSHPAPHPGTGRDEDADAIVQRLIFESEIAAERLIAWVRIGIAASIGIFVLVATEVADHFDLLEAGGMIGAGRGPIVTVIAFVVPGLLGLYLTANERWRPWMAYVFATLDSALLCAGMLNALRRTGIDGVFLATVPIALAIPLAFAVGGLRPRPRVQIVATLAAAVGILWVAILRSEGFEPPESDLPKGLTGFFAFQANALRFALIVGMGLVIALAMHRTRHLLTRSVRESRRRKMLTRFLPGEIAPMVTGGRLDAMRRGQRRVATIFFVDIRDSTSRGEELDPQRLSVFISSFRRRVMRAALAHGGVVDKFVGDGALLLFGVLDPDDDGAAKAIDCARTLLALIDRWNAKRRFNPPVRIGIGIHTGEVYLGVIGDEHRLEFTVLGDAVNIAARLEQLTKAVSVPLLVSGATLEASSGTKDWRLISDEPLRGRSGELPYFAPLPEALRLPPPAPASTP